MRYRVRKYLRTKTLGGSEKGNQSSKCKMQNCGGRSGRFPFVYRQEGFLLAPDSPMGINGHEFSQLCSKLCLFLEIELRVRVSADTKACGSPLYPVPAGVPCLRSGKHTRILTYLRRKVNGKSAL